MQDCIRIRKVIRQLDSVRGIPLDLVSICRDNGKALKRAIISCKKQQTRKKILCRLFEAYTMSETRISTEYKGLNITVSFLEFICMYFTSCEVLWMLQLCEFEKTVKRLKLALKDFNQLLDFIVLNDDSEEQLKIMIACLRAFQCFESSKWVKNELEEIDLLESHLELRKLVLKEAIKCEQDTQMDIKTIVLTKIQAQILFLRQKAEFLYLKNKEKPVERKLSIQAQEKAQFSITIVKQDGEKNLNQGSERQENLQQDALKSQQFGIFQPIVESQSNTDQYQTFSDSSQQFQQQVSQQEKHFQLEREIYNYCMECQIVYSNAWSRVQPLYEVLCKIAHKHGLQVDLIGSFATGLWSPFSDIDFVYIGMPEQSSSESSNNKNVYKFDTLGTKVLNQTYTTLSKQYHLVQQIFSSKQIEFPSIVLTTTKDYGSLKVEISMFEKKNSAKKYVKFITDTIYRNPYIKPAFFALRRLLQASELHDRKKKGLKTYTIFLIVYSISNMLSSKSLSEFFLNILRFFGFGFRFSYETQPIHCSSSVNKMEFKELSEERQAPIKRFNFSDPLNHLNNAGGKNTDVDRLQNMFRSTYEAFHLIQITTKDCEQSMVEFPQFQSLATDVKYPILTALIEVSKLMEK